MNSTRRQFLEQSATAMLSTGLAGTALAGEPEKRSFLRRLPAPVAIAMWDFSWLLRTHPGGGFEDWDRALDELAERGYNAVRIDTFPHLVSVSERPEGAKKFRFGGRPPGQHALWGNDLPVEVDARAALLSFLPKCKQRGILVMLSTWFFGPKGTNDSVRSIEEFVAAWQTTLRFLDSHGLLDNILFIDLLNEYPLYNGFQWLHETARQRAKQAVLDAAKPGEEHLQDQKPTPGMSAAEKAFYRESSAQMLTEVRREWPKFDLALSLSQNIDYATCAELSLFDALDNHIWFSHIAPLAFLNKPMAQAQHAKPEEVAAKYAELKEQWSKVKPKQVQWMDERLALFEKQGRQLNAVTGNTEGWGMISWDEHPSLDWEFVKETAELGVELALKHGQRFVCTSNFTHPHFRRLWADVAWHQRITAAIRAHQG